MGRKRKPDSAKESFERRSVCLTNAKIFKEKNRPCESVTVITDSQGRFSFYVVLFDEVSPREAVPLHLFCVGFQSQIPP